MKILFLHGWHSTPGGLKPTYLREHGHEVINPALDDDDFDEALRVAQLAFDEHAPDVVVGSSRGGALAMNLRHGSTPLVLLCPAWKRWGAVDKVGPGTVVLHSEADEVIPFAESRELIRASGLPESALIVVGNDHRLADPAPLAALLAACERAVVGSVIWFDQTIPIFRVFDVAKALDFYVGFLGFTVDWQHRFDPTAPAYIQVSRGGLTLHLSEHHGDCCPGSAVSIRMRGVAAFHREITSRGYAHMRPGIEKTFYDCWCVGVIDPFGNKIRFNEPIGPAGASEEPSA